MSTTSHLTARPARSAATALTLVTGRTTDPDHGPGVGGVRLHDRLRPGERVLRAG